ncbi:Small ubiquitin-related modifier 2-like protein [Drosera capensis]
MAIPIRAADPSSIKLNIRNQEGMDTSFRLKRNTPMHKLLKQYCAKLGVDYKATCFLINGERFQHIRTADDGAAQDRRVIDATVRASGAGGARSGDGWCGRRGD